MSRKCLRMWLCGICLFQSNIEATEVAIYRGEIVELNSSESPDADAFPDVASWAHLQRRIEALEIVRIGLSVTESEIDAAHAERLSIVQFDADAASKVVKIGANMKQALQKWQESPEQDQAIYESFLMPLDVPLATWESFKKTHATPEAVENMWIPEDEAAARNAGKDAIRDELLRKKLAEHVSGEAIVPEGKAWEAFLEVNAPSATVDDIATLEVTFTQQQVTAALELWMAELIQNGLLQISSSEHKAGIETRARDISTRKYTSSITTATAGAREPLEEAPDTPVPDMRSNPLAGGSTETISPRVVLPRDASPEETRNSKETAPASEGTNKGVPIPLLVGCIMVLVVLVGFAAYRKWCN